MSILSVDERQFRSTDKLKPESSSDEESSSSGEDDSSEEDGSSSEEEIKEDQIGR